MLSIIKITTCMLFSFEALFSKLAIHEITTAFGKKNFGQEHFGESLAIRQIYQDFLPSKFCIVQHFTHSFLIDHTRFMYSPLYYVLLVIGIFFIANLTQSQFILFYKRFLYL